MALNIKPFYPLEHPQETLSVADLIQKISRPTASAIYLKSEVKKDQTFKHHEDVYGLRFKPKRKQRNLEISQETLILLDVI